MPTNPLRPRPSFFAVAQSFSLVAILCLLSACDDEPTYEAAQTSYQHDISLNQAFISTADVHRSITLVGDRYHGDGEGNAILRFDIVDDPAKANVLFTCLALSFYEDLAREIDAAQRAAGTGGNTFRLPIADNGGNLRIESLPNGPNLNELMNIEGTEDRPFRRVHMGFWGQYDAPEDLLRARHSEVIFEAANSGETVQDALNSAYYLLDRFMANNDTLYAYLHAQESSIETAPETTTVIHD